MRALGVASWHLKDEICGVPAKVVVNILGSRDVPTRASLTFLTPKSLHSVKHFHVDDIRPHRFVSSWNPPSSFSFVVRMKSTVS